VHVKFGAPITWTGGTKLTPDSDANAEAVLSSSTKRGVSFEVPVDAKEVYVQIANNGDQDGNYKALTLSAVAPPPAAEEPATPPAATPPAASAAPTSTDDGGCSCEQAPGHSGSTGGAALGLGLALAAFASRRRRR
jgi:MYXO-CTERM domain-containing protein